MRIKAVAVVLLALLVCGSAYGQDVKALEEDFVREVNGVIGLFNCDGSAKEDKLEYHRSWRGQGPLYMTTKVVLQKDGWSYNIEKSNSILFSYVGHARIKGDFYTRKGKTKQECLNAPWLPEGSFARLVYLSYDNKLNHWRNTSSEDVDLKLIE